MRNFFFKFFLYLLFPLSMEASPLYHVFESARIQGFGSAGASFVEGEEAIFYNPARINHGSRMRQVNIVSPQAGIGGVALEFMIDPNRYSKLTFTEEEIVNLIQNENLYFSAQNHTGAVLDKSAFGVLTRSYMQMEFVGDLEFLDTLKVDSTIYIYNGFYYGFSREVLKNFEVGILLKALQKSEIIFNEDMISLLETVIVEEDKNFFRKFHGNLGFGFGVDLGFNYTIPREEHDFSFALVGQNVGGQRFFGTNPPSMDKTLINFGTSYKKKLLEAKQEIIAAIDFKDLLSLYNKKFAKKFHFGLMWKYLEYASLGIGLNQGYPTAGVTFGYKIFEFEMAAYGTELGDKIGSKPSVRFSAMGRLGWIF